MALLDENMPCSICGDALREGDDFVATTHFIDEASDPLSRYSDSAMHRACFSRWEHRDEFGRRYRETMTAIYPANVDYANWPGPPGASIMKSPRPLPVQPKLPDFTCPSCGRGLFTSERGECPGCEWLRFPSDRTCWGQVGRCPQCGFAYRWDGTRCSHCGHGSEATVAGPAT